MNNIFNFFATRGEVYELWDHLAGLPGFQLLETESRPDKANRTFDTFPRVEGEEAVSNYSVAAWVSVAGGRPRPREIRFDTAAAKALGAMGRTKLVSPALVRIGYTPAPNDALIGPTELIYWTEKLAVRSEQFDADQVQQVDWAVLARQIAAIKRHIVAGSAGRWRTAPVSKGVAQLLAEDGIRLWLWGATGTI